MLGMCKWSSDLEPADSQTLSDRRKHTPGKLWELVTVLCARAEEKQIAKMLLLLRDSFSVYW